MSDGFLIKVIPPQGSGVYRLHVRRGQAACALAAIGLVIAGLFAIHLYQLHSAAATIARLQEQGRDEHRRLDEMEREARSLQRRSTQSERIIERIERALGGQKPDADARSDRHAAASRQRASVAALAQRLQRLGGAAALTPAQAGRLTRLASRVLNMRRLADIARRQVLAAIPSLNPVGGAVNAAFGYRTDPHPEFHKGLDLAADYGQLVRASAGGIVAAAGWEGSFGIKVDIDHGNGYHTWYCHLSRTTVVAGQRVAKGDPIAAAGSTGESTGPHLHYQVMHDGVAIDPLPFLNGVPSNVLATLLAGSGVQ